MQENLVKDNTTIDDKNINLEFLMDNLLTDNFKTKLIKVLIKNNKISPYNYIHILTKVNDDDKYNKFFNYLKELNKIDYKTLTNELKKKDIKSEIIKRYKAVFSKCLKTFLNKNDIQNISNNNFVQYLELKTFFHDLINLLEENKQVTSLEELSTQTISEEEKDSFKEDYIKNLKRIEFKGLNHKQILVKIIHKQYRDILKLKIHEIYPKMKYKIEEDLDKFDDINRELENLLDDIKLNQKPNVKIYKFTNNNDNDNEKTSINSDEDEIIISDELSWLHNLRNPKKSENQFSENSFNINYQEDSEFNIERYYQLVSKEEEDKIIKKYESKGRFFNKIQLKNHANNIIFKGFEKLMEKEFFLGALKYSLKHALYEEAKIIKEKYNIESIIGQIAYDTYKVTRDDNILILFEKNIKQHIFSQMYHHELNSQITKAYKYAVEGKFEKQIKAYEIIMDL